jgi:hypothetical protein
LKGNEKRGTEREERAAAALLSDTTHKSEGVMLG